jgi:hypothetical protein
MIAESQDVIFSVVHKCSLVQWGYSNTGQIFNENIGYQLKKFRFSSSNVEFHKITKKTSVLDVVSQQFL